MWVPPDSGRRQKRFLRCSNFRGFFSSSPGFPSWRPGPILIVFGCLKGAFGLQKHGFRTLHLLKIEFSRFPLARPLLEGSWTRFGALGSVHEILLSIGVGFLELFQKAIVVVALCTSHTHLRHFAFQPNVSATSWVMISNVQICYSLKWVTCHTNMSVCRYAIP